jgi:hypothetical protein
MSVENCRTAICPVRGLRAQRLAEWMASDLSQGLLVIQIDG